MSLAMITVVLTALGTPSGGVYGDVNQNGSISAVDALAVLVHVVGHPLPPGWTVDPFGDATCDGNVTAVDAQAILAFAVGKRPPGLCVGLEVWDLVFSDDFDRPDGGPGSDWDVEVYNGTGPAGTVTVANNRLAMTGGEYYAIRYVSPVVGDAIRVSVVATTMPTPYTSPDGFDAGFAVVAGQYGAIVSPELDVISIFRFDSGGQTTVLASGSYAVGGDESHRITLTVEGDRITASVEPIAGGASSTISAIDPQALTAGGIVSMNGAQGVADVVFFDDFVVERQGDAPPDQECRLPAFPDASITLDGQVGDWAGVEPLALDAQGDDSPDFTGDDLRAIYVAQNSESLFVRVDLWEPVNTNFGNGPPGEEYGRYNIVLVNDGPFPQMFVGIAYDMDRGEWSVGHNGSGSGVPEGLAGPTFLGVVGSVIEFGVPLSLIGNPSGYTEVQAEASTTDALELDRVGQACSVGEVLAATVEVAPDSLRIVSLGDTAQLVATARDSDGNWLSGKVFVWTSSDESVAAVDASGLVTSVANGSVTISATADGVTGTAAIEVAQVAAQLGVAAQPTDALAGAMITPAVEVAIQDALGNPVTAATDAVTVALGTNPGGGSLSGTTTANAVSGVATFADLSIDEPGSGYTLTASATGLTSATSDPFAVTPGAGQPVAYVARRFSDDVSVIDVSGDTVLATVAVGDLPSGVSISPDGGFAYVTNFVGNTVSVIETASNTVSATIPVGVGPNHPAITPDGTRIYVPNGSSDNVSVIDASSNTVVATVVVGNDPRNIAITPDGTRAYVTNIGASIISVIDTDPTSPSFHTVVATMEVGGGGPAGIAIRPDGAFAYVRIATGSYPTPGLIQVIDINPASPSFHTTITSVDVPNGIGGMAITPDGTELYAVSNSSNSVEVIRTSDNTVITTLTGFGDPQRVAIAPDGTRAYVTNTFNGVTIVDTDPASPDFHSLIGTVTLGNGAAGVAIASIHR